MNCGLTEHTALQLLRYALRKPPGCANNRMRPTRSAIRVSFVGREGLGCIFFREEGILDGWIFLVFSEKLLDRLER